MVELLFQNVLQKIILAKTDVFDVQKKVKKDQKSPAAPKQTFF